MDIQIEPIKIEQKSVFIQLMELYNYDFSEYEDTDINEYGYFGYAHIDDYWNEGGRYPYFVRVNGKLAGFVLICRHCRYAKDPNTHSVAEFFILRKYRRKGVGKTVAKKVFEQHKGSWEVLQLFNTIPAQRFWRSVISAYTNGTFQECGSADGEWIGFLFDNSQSS